ncbi:MAG: sigma-70 family RNA polymerase sigma factor [Solirubrobacterales bacterium]|nr:sigma-70 family RNA polymerase sigma factor [Solirubrobacterales bacterium]
MAVASDYEVVRDSLRSPAVFGEIFERHARPVYRYVRRRVGDDVASDLTAEVFTRAFRDRHRFDGRSESTLPWLLGIATNVVRMNARRERRRLRAYVRAAASAPSPVSALEVDARLDAQALAPVLAEALAAMPSRQRDVLLLYAWGELSPVEIATALAMAPGTVRSDLHRARGFVEARLATRASRVESDVEQMT